MTRVLIVEDQPGTREALATAFRLGGLEVAGAFASGEDALAGLAEASPDVALVDLGLPGLSGCETIRRMRVALPDLPVLVLTVFETPALIVEAIEAGASGYLLKETPLARVREAVDEVLHGLAPLSPAVARHVLARMRAHRNGPGGQAFSLTEREREALGLLVRGHTYSSVAEAMNVHRKLEVTSKAEAAYVALRAGLIRDGD